MGTYNNTYTSPLGFLKSFGLEYETSNLNLLKKKLLAELDLSGKSTITIKNKEYTKHDIVNIADNLKDVKDLNFHQAILEDPFLLDFLELTILKYDGKIIKKTLYEEGQFIDWVSPYFLTAYTHFAHQIMAKNDMRGWLKLVQIPKMMTDNDMEASKEFFLKTIKIRRDKLFNIISKNEVTENRELVQYLCDNRFLDMTTYFTQPAFCQLRDDLSVLVMKTGIVFFNKIDQEKGKGLLISAINCANSNQVKNKIKEKINKIKNIEHSKTNPIKTIETSNPWNVVLVIFLIIGAIIRITACHN